MKGRGKEKEKENDALKMNGFPLGVICKEETENMKVINASYSTVLWTCRSPWTMRELGKTSHGSRITVMTGRRGEP